MRIPPLVTDNAPPISRIFGRVQLQRLLKKGFKAVSRWRREKVQRRHDGLNERGSRESPRSITAPSGKKI
ncbi:hypothetical protein M408DRAFT_326397, partial [Serendipita vermifera MAFF 305830]